MLEKHVAKTYGGSRIGIDRVLVRRLGHARTSAEWPLTPVSQERSFRAVRLLNGDAWIHEEARRAAHLRTVRCPRFDWSVPPPTDMQAPGA